MPDALVLQTNLPGPAAMVRRRLEAYASAGITTLRVEAAGDTLPDWLGTLERESHEISADNASSRDGMLIGRPGPAF